MTKAAKTKADTPKLVLSTRTQSLPCRLTDEELMGKGGDLARAVQDVATEENRQVDIKTQLKARLAELDARKTQLAIMVSRREEYRDVHTEVLADLDAGVARAVRLDTGEILGTRPLTEDERQQPLPL